MYANKQDLPNALNPAQVSEALGLTELRDRGSACVSPSASVR